jgi:hypothetical protein
MASPTRAQKAAVRAVVYKPARVRKIKADYGSILILMNIRNFDNPDSGPPWIVPDTGAQPFSLRESIRRCRAIATTLRATADDLGDVDIPDADRVNLRTALNQTAAAWDARAVAWSSALSPGADAAVARIGNHQDKAYRAMVKVRQYLRSSDAVADLMGV